MRKINKQDPYPDFAAFVSKNNPTTWDQLPSKISADSRFCILCNEQDCLCGYSAMILDADSALSHIDHYYKRNLFPKKTFDWNNLVVSTTDEDFGGKYKDNTFQIKANDYQHIFNPVIDDMSQYVGFSGNGEIVPLDGLSNDITNKIIKTIEVFNLNYVSLRNKRRDLLLQLESCKDLPKEEVKKAFASQGFVSVVNWFMDHI